MMTKASPVHTSIAIIGGGFSGTLLALHLIERLPSASPHSVVLLEKTGRFGTGVAYATQDPDHYLNVRAEGMGAFPDRRDHFFHWLVDHEEQWKREFPDLIVSPRSFVPRKLYGDYLHELLEKAIKLASIKGISLTCMAEEAVDAALRKDGKIDVELSRGEVLVAEAMVLATSFPPVQRFDVSCDEAAYVENLWEPRSEGLLSRASLRGLEPSSRIVILGTGLTMVDAAISLIRKGYRGEILAVSKHGELPQAHLEEQEPQPFEFKLSELPKKTLPLVRFVRQHVAAAEKKGVSWRAVIDALRPLTVSLWESLPLEEKERFIRHVLSHWNKCRHRIAPKIAAVLRSHQKTGKLRVKASRVKAIKKSEGSARAVVEASPCDIEADYVLNCSGPQMDLRRTQNALLRNLLHKKIVAADPLHRGLQVDERYRARNDFSAPVYAMGQLLSGQRLETVAVPELRTQCKEISEYIYNDLGKDF